MTKPARTWSHTHTLHGRVPEWKMWIQEIPGQQGRQGLPSTYRGLLQMVETSPGRWMT